MRLIKKTSKIETNGQENKRKINMKWKYKYCAQGVINSTIHVKKKTLRTQRPHTVHKVRK